MAPNRYGSSRTRLSAQIDGPILVGHQTYAPELPLTKTTRRLWYSTSFIPYSNTDNIFSFMGPLPRLTKKPDFLEKIFPGYHGWEPVVYSDQPFYFHFLENHVYFHPLEAPESAYINGLNRA